MKTGKKLMGSIGLLAIGMTVATISAAGEYPSNQMPKPILVQFCPRIYDPVCAVRYGERMTFSNVCIAETRGFSVIYGGKCRSVVQRPPKPAFPAGCSREYRPVCGERNGVQRTFSNKCEGLARGFRLLYDSVCTQSVDPSRPNYKKKRQGSDR